MVFRNIFCDYRYYISEGGEESIRNFQYKGGTDSFLYKYCWSPLCNWIVDHCVPDSIAPNTITAFAFFQLIIMHIVTVSYSPDFQTPLPIWLIYLNAFSVFFYQILDNCDGKQARKTQSSSPLGMLFDHGCDSVTTWIIALIVANCMQLGQSVLIYFLLIIISQVTFFLAQWSQYYVGVFRLGYINAIDEGLVLVEVTLFITGVFGQKLWTYQIEQLQITSGELTMIISFIISLVQSFQFIYETMAQIQEKKKAIKSLACCLVLILVYTLIYIIDDIIIEEWGYYIMYIFAIQFSKTTLHIQIAHLSQDPFRQFTKSFVIISLLFLSILVVNQTNPSYIQIKVAIVCCIILSLTTYMHMVICVCLHISNIMGIKVFSIQKPKYQEHYGLFKSEQLGL